MISSSSSNIDQSQPKFTSSGNSKAGAVSDGCYQDQTQITSSENDGSINEVDFDAEDRHLHQLSPSEDGRSVTAHEDVHGHLQLTLSMSKNAEDSELSQLTSAKESQSNVDTQYGEANIIQQSIHQRSDSKGDGSQRGIIDYSAYIPIILFLELSVRESVTGRSTEAIRPARKKFVSLHRWTWTLHQTAY